MAGAINTHLQFFLILPMKKEPVDWRADSIALDEFVSVFVVQSRASLRAAMIIQILFEVEPPYYFSI